ncbi:uncharacterized protein G2W53_041181 [Senna tora]|uniref:Uncharacterized protein n=1 Tax=Senna tora TaxID=362788 RepID=A0A834VYZ4_9FABA|nr:uncharacterized protein G2W53_041181 [Senna tora]
MAPRNQLLSAVNPLQLKETTIKVRVV